MEMRERQREGIQLRVPPLSFLSEKKQAERALSGPPRPLQGRGGGLFPRLRPPCACAVPPP